MSEEKKEGAPVEGAKVEEPKESLVIMQKGDYNVHVLIEEVKNLIEIEEDHPPIPRVKITCLGKTERTAKLKLPAQDCVINEHFYFDKTNLTAEMLDSEKILIEVYDNGHTKRKDYFGIYEFDFGYIYNQENHAINNIWIGLANPESDDISKVRGYLKLSISVLNEKDMRIELEPRENDISDCLIPAQINMKYKQISFYFYRGEEFPDMDSFFSTKKTGRRCEGFIEVKYMGIMRKTKTVEMKDEVILWNQIVDIPATSPAVSQKIVLLIKDEDTRGDDIVGSVELKIDDIYAGKYQNLTFLDVYGSPLNKKGGMYDLMNYNGEIGSSWNGRILIKIKVTDINSPIAQVREMREDEKLGLNDKAVNRKESWTIKCRIISAYFLPEDNREYSIKIKMQEKVGNTTTKAAEGGCIHFCESFNVLINTLTTDPASLPDLFIYLVDKNQSEEYQNLCFQRIKADIFHLNNTISVIKLLPDPVIGKVNSMMRSGILKCKFCMYHSSEASCIPTEKEFQSGGRIPEIKLFTLSELSGKTTKPIEVDNEDDDLEALLSKPKAVEIKPQINEPPKEDTMKTYSICAIVYMSKGLVSAEKDGTSDPFVRLQLGNQKIDTSVKSGTANGIWNEKILFRDVIMDLKDDTTWPIFMLSVFDYNKIKSDVPLGYNYVWLINSSYSLNDTELREPKWHNLFLPKSNKQQGQILLSFYIFDENNVDKIPKINYLPETEPYKCEINILGLRELKPLGMIGVKKPFIKFALSSLNVSGKIEEAHSDIQTDPVSGGANPTINAVIKFETRLPKDMKFMPELQCEVYDNMLSGLHNSLLGVFTIDLRKIVKKTERQVDEDIRVYKSQIGTNLLGGIIMKQLSIKGIGGPGMSEKDPQLLSNIANKDLSVRNENLEEERKKKNKEEKKEDENNEDSEDEKFLEEDENNMEISQENIDLNAENLANTEVRLPTQGQKLSYRNSLKVTGDFIKNNLDDSKYFVMFPVLKSFHIPGYGKDNLKGKKSAPPKVKQEESKESEVELTGAQNEEDEKIPKEFLIEDLTKAPSSKLFFPIGYLLKNIDNVKPEESTKHYRRIYGCPLEHVVSPFWKIKSPFDVQKVRRGKYIDISNETSLFDAMKDIHGKILHRYDGKEFTDEKSEKSDTESEMSTGFIKSIDSEERSFGKFKGKIRIARKEKMDAYESFIEKNKGLEFKNKNEYEEFRKKLSNKTNVVIRVYILELNGLAKKDIGSESDPYIKLYLNDKLKVNEQKNYQQDQANCKWYKHYDIPGVMPGSSSLKIEVWDHDPLITDDFIGYTVIDLEDRFFNKYWQSFSNKPVEVRPLINQDIPGCQGKVYMWLEIFPDLKKLENPVWKITPEPLTELQLRFIVWETEGMEMKDIEGTSDIYVIGYVDQQEMQKTDVHYRCQTGNASFNWRMLLPLRLPVQKPTINIQVYDKDLFASDDYISGASINLGSIVDIPKNFEIPISFDRTFFNGLTKEQKENFKGIEFVAKEDDPDGIKFWVQCYKGKKSADAEGEKGGRVMCSLQILPKQMADLEKVGKGRDEPNVNPYLPPPTGRFEFSLNPFKMFNQCVGPKFRGKMYCCCCCCILIIYLCFALPDIIGGIL